jgi:hypothetical protein
MKIIVDREKLRESKYDENGFAVCECGDHRYPSKKMLVDFLRPLRLPGTADIWSSSDLNQSTTTIHLEITYSVKRTNNDGSRS